MRKALFYFFLFFVALSTRPWQWEYVLGKYRREFNREEEQRKQKRELRKETKRITREAKQRGEI